MPIFWCFQKISDLIGEINLADPYQYLGVQEKEIYQKLRFVKRQTEWLGGRLAAKALAQAVDLRFQDLGDNLIELLAQSSGAPFLKLTDTQGKIGSVSLSHSNGYILCAYSPENISLGVDLELIEPRAKEFIDDYFTKKEVDQVSILEESYKKLYPTIIWSGKESALKATSSGLRVDTRSVEVSRIDLNPQINGWAILGMKSSLFVDNSLSLLWRREGEFVITACIPSVFVKELIRVNL